MSRRPRAFGLELTTMTTSAVILPILEQHVEELTTLWPVRNRLCEAADIRLRDLARFDDRIAAYHDGCVLGGDDALRLLTAQLADTSAGAVFAAALVALSLNDRAALLRCVALAEASPKALRGMKSALGWIESARLRGVVKNLLASPSAIHRVLGLAACRLHGVDPGATVLAELLQDPGNDVRAEAIRTAGVLGQVNLLLPVPSRVDADPLCQFWSAWSAVLLGDRGARARETLMTVASSSAPHRRRAFHLFCQAAGTTAAHEMLRNMAVDPAQIRWVIEGSGIVGDPVYVPWLIKHMAEPKTARLAGEAFSLITGINFGQSRLERPRPEGFESGPNDNPADPDVDMDSDDGLPWPDATKTEKWWESNLRRFPKGTRYFMGAPVTRDHCIEVLKTGEQRQRILAAHYLCLLDPGTTLFNTSAPTWRQRRWLAKM
jgi:uncharacterized protein (TIGR02270 family)